MIPARFRGLLLSYPENDSDRQAGADFFLLKVPCETALAFALSLRVAPQTDVLAVEPGPSHTATEVNGLHRLRFLFSAEKKTISNEKLINSDP